ncbi:hypothetical protein ENSA5_22590 [Enhygromyxa salina]|uniref:Uncharacterized protein n=1 Tax=Enhygromyxa salina TaxID=215803 RepID=A0A2S9YBQ3_9BACT|nr:hypothetical protein [Enhygromyxa salina]PRQ02441.1 hypothetical protein ENSA5_22590 [Enhygromyxa salina]
MVTIHTRSHPLGLTFALLGLLAAGGEDPQADHEPERDVFVALELSAGPRAELVGPSNFGGTVLASATLDVGCTSRGCAAAEFSYDRAGTLFTIEELDLFEDDPVVITDGVDSLVADRVDMRLWQEAEGYEVCGPLDGAALGYEIPAGAALFVISSHDRDGESNRLMAANATDIWISEDRGRGTWTIGGFEIAFEDADGELWTVTLGDSEWQG